MANKIEQTVRECVEPVADTFGFELVDVEYRKRDGEPIVTIFIHKEGGVDLNDCEKMHRAIDEILDDVDPTNGAPYTLNVSSQGLDRAFKYDRDYERNIGNKVEIKFFTPFDGKKKMEGILVEHNESNIKIICDKKEVAIRLDKIAKINLAVEF